MVILAISSWPHRDHFLCPGLPLLLNDVYAVYSDLKESIKGEAKMK